MNKQTYYHFLSSKYAIDDLERKRIKVSLINELNDPFELLPYLRYKELKKRKIYHNIRREVSKKYGLLCFSKYWYEPLLWGHYADKHKGVAIGFRILEGDILKVEYNSKPKRIKFELTNNKEENKKLFLSLAKTKYEKWSYESEYRVLIELDNCDKDKKGCYFIKFADRLKVDEIILGCKFNKKERGRIIDLAKKLNVNENKIKHARQSWEEYKINKCGTKTNELKIMYSKTRAKTAFRPAPNISQANKIHQNILPA